MPAELLLASGLSENVTRLAVEQFGNYKSRPIFKILKIELGGSIQKGVMLFCLIFAKPSEANGCRGVSGHVDSPC